MREIHIDCANAPAINAGRKSVPSPHMAEVVAKDEPKEEIMLKLSLAVVCAAALLLTSSQAQPTRASPDPKTGAEMTGTIKEYTTGSALVLETVAPNEPVQFKLSGGVTYADTDGKTIDAAVTME